MKYAIGDYMSPCVALPIYIGCGIVIWLIKGNFIHYMRYYAPKGRAINELIVCDQVSTIHTPLIVPSTSHATKKFGISEKIKER